MNLLIVDDEIITVKGLLQGIQWKQCGITGEVFVAYDASQARQILEDKEICVLLCDIEMPGESGIELVRFVNEKYPDIACIFLTCHANFTYAQEALRLQCHDYILKPAPYADIAASVQRLVTSLEEKRRQNEAAKYGSQWLQQQIRSAENAQGDKRTPKEIVQNAVNYIMENLASDSLSVSVVAKKLYLNDDYLNRIFKREKGISVGQFIIQERMNLAKQLLQTPTISISVVAAQAGYSNYPHFVSTFKKLHGCTPTQYRNRIIHKKDAEFET